MMTNGAALELMPQIGGEGGEEGYNLVPAAMLGGEGGADGDTYTLNPDELAAFTAIAQECGGLALLDGSVGDKEDSSEANGGSTAN